MKSFIAIALGSLIFTQALAAEFIVRSLDIKPASSIGEEQVFNGFGCQGGNISPALNWSGAPAGTKSYAVTVYDPDAGGQTTAGCRLASSHGGVLSAPEHAQKSGIESAVRQVNNILGGLSPPGAGLARSFSPPHILMKSIPPNKPQSGFTLTDSLREADRRRRSGRLLRGPRARCRPSRWRRRRAGHALRRQRCCPHLPSLAVTPSACLGRRGALTCVER